MSLWPRWRASGETRVTHLGHLDLRSAFTSVEGVLLAAGVVATAAAGGWGLWRVGTDPGWLVAWALALAIGGAVWWRLARWVADAPSAGSDMVELGWDDALRFRRVRTLALLATWASPVALVALDGHMAIQLGGASDAGFLPTVPMIGATVLVLLAFKRGNGLWRRAWAPRQAEFPSV